MNEKLLNLIEENARLSNKEMSVMLGISEQEVESEIKALEDNGVIKGYKAIVDIEKNKQRNSFSTYRN